MTPAIETSSSYRPTGLGLAWGAWTTHRYVEQPSVPSPLPRWEEAALARLAQLERMTPNWDAYGALPVTRTHSTRAARFLSAVMADDSALPDIVPLADGGVQLEWYLPWGRLDFITDSDSPYPVILKQLDGGEAHEYAWRGSAVGELGDLRECLKGQAPV